MVSPSVFFLLLYLFIKGPEKIFYDDWMSLCDEIRIIHKKMI
jgi:hypothetical protein